MPRNENAPKKQLNIQRIELQQQDETRTTRLVVDFDHNGHTETYDSFSALVSEIAEKIRDEPYYAHFSGNVRIKQR